MDSVAKHISATVKMILSPSAAASTRPSAPGPR